MPDYIFEKNVDVPLQGKQHGGKVRVNVYRPDSDGCFPVLVTYGPCEFAGRLTLWGNHLTYDVGNCRREGHPLLKVSTKSVCKISRLG